MPTTLTMGLSPPKARVGRVSINAPRSSNLAPSPATWPRQQSLAVVNDFEHEMALLSTDTPAAPVARLASQETASSGPHADQTVTAFDDWLHLPPGWVLQALPSEIQKEICRIASTRLFLLIMPLITRRRRRLHRELLLAEERHTLGRPSVDEIKAVSRMAAAMPWESVEELRRLAVPRVYLPREWAIICGSPVDRGFHIVQQGHLDSWVAATRAGKSISEAPRELIRAPGAFGEWVALWDRAVGHYAVRVGDEPCFCWEVRCGDLQNVHNRLPRDVRDQVEQAALDGLGRVLQQKQVRRLVWLLTDGNALGANPLSPRGRDQVRPDPAALCTPAQAPRPDPAPAGVAAAAPDRSVIVPRPPRSSRTQQHLQLPARARSLRPQTGRARSSARGFDGAGGERPAVLGDLGAVALQASLQATLDKCAALESKSRRQSGALDASLRLLRSPQRNPTPIQPRVSMFGALTPPPPAVGFQAPGMVSSAQTQATVPMAPTQGALLQSPSGYIRAGDLTASRDHVHTERRSVVSPKRRPNPTPSVVIPLTHRTSPRWVLLGQLPDPLRWPHERVTACSERRDEALLQQRTERAEHQQELEAPPPVLLPRRKARKLFARLGGPLCRVRHLQELPEALEEGGLARLLKKTVAVRRGAPRRACDTRLAAELILRPPAKKRARRRSNGLKRADTWDCPPLRHKAAAPGEGA
eukprot:TRINITY_DN19339_c0_g1_i1.p1 TRINITY_DN19339_c0_g1~~TRINITY_DN19339_c0_g1_i1.p1  ORF type:complete len:730 (+),score=97.80 TRINITY_DN19339_c0_g1_i1:93-2192(+)